MRVALVCPYDLGRFGGVQEQVLLLGRWLADQGHDVTTIGPGGAAGTVGVGATVPIRINRSVAPVSLDPRAGARVRAAVAGADVVHVHEPFVPFVSTAARRSGPGVAKVATFHADPSPFVRGAYRRAAFPARRLLDRYEVVTAVSPVAASAIGGLAPARLIPNAVDVAAYRPEPGDPSQVAFVGRDEPRKGLDVLVAAWPQVMARVPGAHLTVNVKRPDLDGVSFVGRLGDDEKRRLLERASVFCAPNLGGESFGIILVEAMAAGCAVVASGLPAFAHVLGAAGVLVKPGDVDGLADAIASLLLDGARRRRLQEAAIASSGRFAIEVVGPAYVSAYEDAVAAASR